MEMDDIEPGGLPLHHFQHRHVRGEWIRRSVVEAKRLGSSRHQRCRRSAVAAREQSDVMPLPYQLGGQVGHHALGAAIQFWRHALVEWGDLRDSHFDVTYIPKKFELLVTDICLSRVLALPEYREQYLFSP